MKKLLTVSAMVLLQAMPTLARDMIDEKTKEYTPYGIAIGVIAAAQVNEMRCGKKDQITLALAKVNRAGFAINLNDKEDYSAVLFQATRVMEALQKEGTTAWCAARAASLDAMLRAPD